MMKKLISILLTLAMALSLCACGGPKYDESLMGVYTCYAVEMLGLEMKADEVLSQTSTLELKQGGKAKMNIEGTSGSVKYTLDGETITMDIDGETATGTLKDGVLNIEIMSMNMYFIQEGKEVPEVLTSGDDRKIERWRRRTAAFRTLSRRPDLLSRANVMDYLEDEVYLGVVLPAADENLSGDMAILAETARAYGVVRLIAAPETPDGYEELCKKLEKFKDIKCVPSISRMMEWTERKKHGPLLVVAAEVPNGIPWMEAKRRLVETEGPVLLLFGGLPRRGKAVHMRPQETTGGELPRTALVSATLDRFFGSR